MGELYQHPSSVPSGNSVFGPPRPAVWEFQLASKSENGIQSSSFNFYRKNQRNKTLYFRIMNNDFNSRNDYRVQQVAGGIILFPYKNDDRFQMEFGGIYDNLIDTSLTSTSLITRLTYRPKKFLWLRYGHESYDGYTGSLTSIAQEKHSTNYGVIMYRTKVFDLMGLHSTHTNNNQAADHTGVGGLLKLPFNFYAFAGNISGSKDASAVTYIAAGRWAPFRSDNIPSGFFAWRKKSGYDFIISGLFWGKRQLFVQPAATGMTYGLFISSVALRENSELRRAQLMSITDEHRNADFSLFFINLKQDIHLDPGYTNYIEIKAIQFYHIFYELQYSVLSKPTIGIFYNEETEPDFSEYPVLDHTTDYWSFQIGTTVSKQYIINAVYSPFIKESIIALSYYYQKAH